MKKKKVHLDFGHGGKDPGAVGNNIKEKDIVLPVGLGVGKILEDHGVIVSYSRKTDIFISLSGRVRMANSNNVDVMVSLHCNAAGTSSGQGVETFRFERSTVGLPLAQSIQNSLIEDKKLYTRDRGVKEARFTVLTTKAPAALVELGFVSNQEDSIILKTKQKELSIAVAKGILKYLGIKYKDKPKKEIDNSKGKVKMDINGKPYLVEGFLENGTNYVSLREVAEILGMKVDWDSRTKSVIIRK